MTRTRCSYAVAAILNFNHFGAFFSGTVLLAGNFDSTVHSDRVPCDGLRVENPTVASVYIVHWVDTASTPEPSSVGMCVSKSGCIEKPGRPSPRGLSVDFISVFVLCN